LKRNGGHLVCACFASDRAGLSIQVSCSEFRIYFVASKQLAIDCPGTFEKSATNPVPEPAGARAYMAAGDQAKAVADFQTTIALAMWVVERRPKDLIAVD
jgi:hypothetical protein